MFSEIQRYEVGRWLEGTKTENFIVIIENGSVENSNTETATGFRGLSTSLNYHALEDYVNSLFEESELILKKIE